MRSPLAFVKGAIVQCFKTKASTSKKPDNSIAEKLRIVVTNRVKIIAGKAVKNNFFEIDTKHKKSVIHTFDYNFNNGTFRA